MRSPPPTRFTKLTRVAAPAPGESPAQVGHADAGHDAIGRDAGPHERVASGMASAAAELAAWTRAGRCPGRSAGGLRASSWRSVYGSPGSSATARCARRPRTSDSRLALRGEGDGLPTARRAVHGVIEVHQSWSTPPPPPARRWRAIDDSGRRPPPPPRTGGGGSASRTARRSPPAAGRRPPRRGPRRGPARLWPGRRRRDGAVAVPVGLHHRPHRRRRGRRRRRRCGRWREVDLGPPPRRQTVRTAHRGAPSRSQPNSRGDLDGDRAGRRPRSRTPGRGSRRPVQPGPAALERKAPAGPGGRR